MYPLAHVTLACGTVWLGARFVEGGRVAGPAGEVPLTPAGGTRARVSVADAIDYRLVALGALLPDLVDKPLGRLIFRDALDGNGHVFAHTLLFALVFLVPGAFLLRRAGDPRLLSVGVAVLTHLLSDPVTHAPENLFWPLLGWQFSKVTLLRPWATVLTEVAAGLIILMVVWSLMRAGRLELLLRVGRLYRRQPAGRRRRFSVR